MVGINLSYSATELIEINGSSDRASESCVRVIEIQIKTATVDNII